MRKNNRSVSLVELLISVAVVSIMILSFYSIDTFSRNQVLNSDRRAKVQNELSYALEHMGKYVQQGVGNNLASDNQAIQTFAGGFRVRVDFNIPQNPFSLNNKAWIRYRRAGNNLIVSCSTTGSGTCGSFTGETLSSRVMTFDSTPADNGTSVYVNLVGRYTPAAAVSLRNPQVEVRTKLICNSCSYN
ncbi:MAG: type II secretion system protein [Candidatus Omnitrophota bacterium]